MLHAPDLLHALTGLRLAHPIYVYQQIGSTNDEAKRLAESGAPEGLLIVAEEQTAGRGRLGRQWLTPPGGSLAFSLILRPTLPAAQAARLTMLAGVAVCEAIEQTTPLTAQLKWPNDILIAGQKAGGLLLETALIGDELGYAVLGLGLNISFVPTGVDFPATSLQAAGAEVDRLRLLLAILTRLEAHYANILDDTLPSVWRARLALMGVPSVLRAPDGTTHAGHAVDVSPDGALLFQTDAGETLRVLAGDVSLRPQLGQRTLVA